MATDRELLKRQQAGVFATTGASDPNGEVREFHTEERNITKYGTENAATNVAETAGFYVRKKSRCRAITVTTATTVANNATDYDVIYVYKRTPASGVAGSATLLGSYNTATAAQGAITANVPASFSLVNNSDLDIAAGSVVTYQVGKFGAGKLLDASVITVDLEAI